jgi:putative addiction module component (TIGR02574 family)
VETNRSMVDGELYQAGCTRVQYFSSPAVPVLPDAPLEPRRGRPSRLDAEQQQIITAEAEKLPLTDAQKQDLQRRLANYEANRQAGSTWEEVKDRLQERG